MRTISRNVLGPSFAVPKSPPLKGSQAPSAVFFSFQFLFSPLFKDSSLWTRLESDPCNHHSATQILIAYHLQGSAPWGWTRNYWETSQRFDAFPRKKPVRHKYLPVVAGVSRNPGSSESPSISERL